LIVWVVSEAEKFGEVFCLECTQAVCGGQLFIAVEPDVPESDPQTLVSEELDGAFDVVAVNVRDDEQFKVTFRHRHAVGNVLAERLPGAERPAIDQDVIPANRVAILYPEAIALVGGKHLDGEHVGLL
jgi:hypothetical protein